MGPLQNCCIELRELLLIALILHCIAAINQNDYCDTAALMHWYECGASNSPIIKRDSRVVTKKSNNKDM